MVPESGENAGHGPLAWNPPSVAPSLVFAVSLVALLVAHQVGDLLVQTDRQARARPTRGFVRRAATRAMAGHLASYHAWRWLSCLSP